MKTLKEALNIINGSKSYEFERNEVGQPTYSVSNYRLLYLEISEAGSFFA